MTDDKQEKFKKRLKDFFNQEFPVGGAVQDIAQESPTSGAAKDIAFDKRKEDGDSSAKKQKIKDKQEQLNRENKKINFINEVLGTDLAVWGKLFDWDVDSNYQKIRKTMRAAWIRYTNTHKVSGNKDISTQVAQVQLKPQENTSAEKDNMTEEEQMDNLIFNSSSTEEAKFDKECLQEWEEYPIHKKIADITKWLKSKETETKTSRINKYDRENLRAEYFFKKWKREILDEFTNLLNQAENQDLKNKFYAMLIFHRRYWYYCAGSCPEDLTSTDENGEKKKRGRMETEKYYKQIRLAEQQFIKQGRKMKADDRLNSIILVDAEANFFIENFPLQYGDREAEEKLFKDLMQEWLDRAGLTRERNSLIKKLTKLLVKAAAAVLPVDLDNFVREEIKKSLLTGLHEMKLRPKLKAIPEAFYEERDKILLTDEDGKLLKGCGAYAQYLGIHAALKGLKAPDDTLEDKDYEMAVVHFGSCKKCKESIDKIVTMLEHQGYAKIRNPFAEQKHISRKRESDFSKFKINEAEPLSEYAFSRYLLLLLSKGDIKKAKEVWNRKKDNYPGLRRSFSVLSEEKTNGSL